jgi:hypothetical protein
MCQVTRGVGRGKRGATHHDIGQSRRVGVQTRTLADNGDVGEEVNQTGFSRARRREYRRKVQLCLDVFETMLTQSSFEFDRPMTGMEIECNLVDAEYQPAMSNREVLESIADPAYQTELGAYNIEFNVPPRPLPGHAALELEAEVRASLNAAEAKAA